MTSPFRWFADLSIARRLILLFLLFTAAMAAVVLHLRQLAEEEVAEIALLQTAIQQKEQLIALETALSSYAALLDARQSVIASRDFRGLQSLKNRIATSRAEAENQIKRFNAVYPEDDVDTIMTALTVMTDAQDTYLRRVVTGDVVAASRQQKEIARSRRELADVIARRASKGATDFNTIRDDLAELSRNLSFAIGLAVTVMVIASALFLALILFSVSRPLGHVFQAINGLDRADRAAFPEDTGPPEFRAIGRALGSLGRRLRAQRTAEEQLRLSETKLRQFAECSADVFWEKGADLRYTWIQAANLDGKIAPSDMLGRTRWEVAGADPDHDPNWRRHRNDMLKRRPFRDFLYRSDTPGSDRPCWWRVNGAPILDCNGGFVGYRGTGTDVTEHVAMTEELRRSQSRDAMSRLSGGVAHDFNNLLTVLQSNLELLQKRADLKAPLREMLTRCLRATERGSRLTAQLLTLGRRQSLHPEHVDIGKFLEEFGELIRRTLPSRIRTSLDVAQTLPPVRVDPAMLQDAMLNLVINARDAMPEGGSLTIAAAPLLKEDAIIIRITDSGNGIPDNIRDKVFEPFFTTKDVGNGSGLGLAMVRGFVEQTNGAISLTSMPGKGTTIAITLPLAMTNEQTISEPTRMQPRLPRGRGEMILLVEADDDVRSSMESILNYLGYTVTSSPSAVEALRAVDDARFPIALIISDVVMPGDIHGDDLAAIIAERHPQIPVVLMTGHTEQGIRKDVLSNDVPVLSKPVSTGALQQVLLDRVKPQDDVNEDSADAYTPT
ncbi:MAG: ATP-binding protein [Pseudomonadota bacterium]